MEPSSVAGVFLEGPVRDRLERHVTVGDPRMEDPMKTWEGDCPHSAPPAICSAACPSSEAFCPSQPPHCAEPPDTPKPPPATHDPMYCPETMPPHVC